MYPKTARLLRSCDFRTTYDQGARLPGPYFAAWVRRRDETGAPRIGFTTPRALGGAVVRNRLKRRIREAVRLHYTGLAPGWDIVINPRRAALEAAFPALEAEVERLFSKCKE